MSHQTVRRIFLVLAASLFLGQLLSCGTGRVTSDPKPSGNWDALVWDQENWQ